MGSISANLGFGLRKFDGPDGLADTADDIFLPNRDVPIILIDVDDMFAQSADIIVKGDYLIGTGVLDAPGNTLIEVTNSSPAFLKLNKMEIPDRDGGHLFFNDVNIIGATLADRNASINALNDVFHKLPVFAPPNFLGNASFIEITTAQNSAPPLINVVHSFDPDDPQTRLDFPGALLPAIEFSGVSSKDPTKAGPVNNLRGKVRIENVAGSISVAADINANTIDIKAGKDFVLSFIEGFRHLGGDPATLYRDIALASEAGKTDRILTTQRSGTGTSIAGNNVFIAGRFLNINGTVQSGIADWSVEIQDTTALQTEIDQFEADHTKDPSERFFEFVGPAVTTIGPGDDLIRAFWDTQEDLIELRATRVEGGFMRLVGHVMNTSGGKLNVMDGFGRINIDNQTAHDLVLRDLSTARAADSIGIEGKIHITDSAKTGAGKELGLDANGNPLFSFDLDTIITRVGDTITITDSTTRDSNGDASHVTTTSGRTTSYTPLQDQRHVFVTGQDFTEIQIHLTRESDWAGIDFLVPDATVEIDITIPTDPRPLAEGEYQQVDAGAANYKYTFNDVTLSSNTTVERWTVKGGFLGLTTGLFTLTVTQSGLKDIHTHSIKADFPIGVEFIGYDEGQIRVVSDADVIIGGRLNNLAGSTSIITSGGAIIQESEGLSVSGTHITFEATDGIGDAGIPIRTDLQQYPAKNDARNPDTSRDPTNFSLTATTTSGDVFITEIDGEMKINQVTTSDGNVTLIAQTDMTAKSSSSLVQGRFIDLLSQHGGIGSPGPTLNIDTGVKADAGLIAKATFDIDVKEIAGDLQLVSAVSNGGNVFIEVTDGDLIDDNLIESRDTRTEEQLLSLWNDVRLIGQDAQNSVTDNLDAYQALKQREYTAYWQLRGADAYDQNFTFTFSAKESDVVY